MADTLTGSESTTKHSTSMKWVPLRNSVAEWPKLLSTAAPGSPMAPSRIACRTAWRSGLYRLVWSTLSRTPLASHASIILSASSRLVASGFSTKMPFTPALAACTVAAACVWSPVVTPTMSRSSFASISPRSV